MMAATLQQSRNNIPHENVAREPGIVDLANILNKMGANCRCRNRKHAYWRGRTLDGTIHIPDRIEAGTFMAAALQKVMCLSKMQLKATLISKLGEMGVQFIEKKKTESDVIGPDGETNLWRSASQVSPNRYLKAQMTIAQY